MDCMARILYTLDSRFTTFSEEEISKLTENKNGKNNKILTKIRAFTSLWSWSLSKKSTQKGGQIGSQPLTTSLVVVNKIFAGLI